MEVFKEELRFIPEDSKKIKRLSLRLPEGIEEIIIKSEYSPVYIDIPAQNRRLITEALKNYHQQGQSLCEQELELKQAEYFPLRNLIRFALFSPGGEMRAQGINFFRRVQISEKLASLGCTPGAIQAGIWHLILEVHAVISPEVFVNIEVQFKRGLTPGIKATEERLEEDRELARLKIVPRGIERGKRDDSRWYAGDMHVHSHHSDGRHSVGDLVRFFSDNRYDFFVLSDHNTTAGWRDNLPGEYLVLPGIEVTTFRGHLVAVNTTEYVDWYDLDLNSDFTSTARQIKERGALLSVAHPGFIGDPVCTGCRWNYGNFNWEYADCLEVLLDPTIWRKEESERSLYRWENLLKRGMRPVAVAGSDLHDFAKDHFSARTWIKADSYTREGLIEGLKKGRVYLSTGFGINFSVQDQKGRKYGPGDLIWTTTGSQLLISGRITGITGEYRVEVVKNGDIINRALDTFQDTVEGDSWYYSRVYQRNLLIGLTNPVFLKVLD